MRVLPVLLSAALTITTAVVTTPAAQASGSCTIGTITEKKVPASKSVGKLVVAIDRLARTASACFYRIGEASGGDAELYVEISGPSEYGVQGPAHYNGVGGHAGPITVPGTCVTASGWIKWRGTKHETHKVNVC
jgi:hypothetical protein